MERYLTADHERLRAEVRDFAQQIIAPRARDLDERAEFPWEAVKAMAERGWLGLTVPRELGGAGLDYLSYLVVIEELAKVDASHAITVSAHTGLALSPLLAFGSDAQKRKYVPLLARTVLGGFGLTEPAAGSDASRSRTRAQRENGGYRVSGSKIFITHAGVGEIFVVTAVTDPDLGPRGITSFIVTKPTVDLDRARSIGYGHSDALEFAPGVYAGKKEDKMGWRASDTRELILEDAFVPEQNRLGGEGEGFVNFMKTLDAGRIGLAALSLGLAQGALASAILYADRRTQFGKKLREFQALQFEFADLATGIEAGRHLTYHAAWLKERAKRYTKEAAMAKLFCSELAMKATIRAVQMIGGLGYTDQYPVERMMRDAKVCEIGEGTSEIQRMVIARNLISEMLGGASEIQIE
ncbi:MAG: acyl-CoA dehydrogenase family protein [Gemmatimonadetes bacterium]|nr:acyl-CoA dehydrogenase family protein [Gemmatimonadota bacterium]